MTILQDKKYELFLLLRVLIAFFFPVNFFYTIFLPLTIYPSMWLFQLSGFDALISGNLLTVNSQPLAFISACIAPYAYYLLLILILLTKDMAVLIRVKVFLLGSLMILAGNILRIFILVLVLFNLGKNAFDTIHIIFWYAIATVYVALVWIILVKVFKIKSIPIYSDFKYLKQHSLFKKKGLYKHK